MHTQQTLRLAPKSSPKASCWVPRPYRLFPNPTDGASSYSGRPEALQYTAERWWFLQREDWIWYIPLWLLAERCLRRVKTFPGLTFCATDHCIASTIQCGTCYLTALPLSDSFCQKVKTDRQDGLTDISSLRRTPLSRHSRTLHATRSFAAPSPLVLYRHSAPEVAMRFMQFLCELGQRFFGPKRRNGITDIKSLAGLKVPLDIVFLVMDHSDGQTLEAWAFTNRQLWEMSGCAANLILDQRRLLRTAARIRSDSHMWGLQGE